MDTIISSDNLENEIPAKVTEAAPIGKTGTIGTESQKSEEPGKALKVGLSLLTVLLTLRYVIWRLTVNQWHYWWLALPLLLAELFTAMHILGYQYTVWPRRNLEISPVDNPYVLPVFMFIPTVNEGDDVLGPTVMGAVSAKARLLALYPQAKVRIIVCNDGFVANIENWESVEKLAKAMGVECITRTQRGGAKAGNIEHARQAVGATGNCLLAVLDADQVAEPEFLVQTIAPFADPSIGWVQTRQFYRNTDITVTRWAENQATLFYDWVCPGKSSINSSYICGTNVVIRAIVLDQIGGFPTESVTEDFAASIRTHQSWRSVYLKDVLARGLGPLDLTGYFVQQSRWSRGTIGVLRSDWRRLIVPGKGGLTAGQRVQYFLSGTHYLCGLRDLIFLSTALISLALSESPIKPVSIPTIAYYLIPYILASQALILLQARSTSVFSGMIIGYSSFPTLVLSSFEAMINRKMRFRVTPKSESRTGDLRAIYPHMVIAGLCIIVLVHAFMTGTALGKTSIIPLFWVIYALCILTPTFVLARLRKV